MTILTPTYIPYDPEENDPRYHTDDECPYYRELAHKGGLAVGTGGYPICDWCATAHQQLSGILMTWSGGVAAAASA